MKNVPSLIMDGFMIMLPGEDLIWQFSDEASQ